MDTLRRLFARIRDAVARRRQDDEFTQELDAHLAMLADDYRRRGLGDEAARRAARLRLGNVTALRETHRREAGLPWLETLAQDSRYAARTLRKAPGFTIVAVLTLADPVTLAIVALLILAVVVSASVLPARRAMRVDPMVTLRDE